MSVEQPGGLRKAAAQAVELARRTSDRSVRAALLDLAQKWLAQESIEVEGQRRLDGALQEFNRTQLFEAGHRKAARA
jgi:hypothetical protein